MVINCLNGMWVSRLLVASRMILRSGMALFPCVVHSLVGGKVLKMSACPVRLVTDRRFLILSQLVKLMMARETSH